MSIRNISQPPFVFIIYWLFNCFKKLREKFYTTHKSRTMTGEYGDNPISLQPTVMGARDPLLFHNTTATLLLDSDPAQTCIMIELAPMREKTMISSIHSLNIKKNICYKKTITILFCEFLKKESSVCQEKWQADGHRSLGIWL